MTESKCLAYFSSLGTPSPLSDMLQNGWRLVLLNRCTWPWVSMLGHCPSKKTMSIELLFKTYSHCGTSIAVVSFSKILHYTISMIMQCTQAVPCIGVTLLCCNCVQFNGFGNVTRATIFTMIIHVSQTIECCTMFDIQCSLKILFPFLHAISYCYKYQQILGNFITRAVHECDIIRCFTIVGIGSLVQIFQCKRNIFYNQIATVVCVT